eukprot:1809418-Rhodomonas_salina.1
MYDAWTCTAVMHALLSAEEIRRNLADMHFQMRSGLRGDCAGVRQLRLNGAESFLDCTKVTKESGVRSRNSVVSHNGKHETAGDDQFHYLLLKGRARKK